MAGQWKNFFSNDHPITLELACGKGEYTTGLARILPGRNFIGIDVKGNRIWVGAKKAIAENLRNVAFVRTQIDRITEYFSPGEVREIWLPFPDPQLRGSKLKKRLTHPKYLRIYQSILSPGALIHLKTDSPALYNFTRQVIDLYNLQLHKHSENVQQDEWANEALKIKTHYEGLNISRSDRIFYLQFSLPDGTLPDKDKQLKELFSETESD